MTKTIWIDWDNKTVFQNEDELKAEYERTVVSYTFFEWLENNFSASEVWDWTDEERKEIEAEYKQAEEDGFYYWVRSTFQGYEIRV